MITPQHILIGCVVVLAGLFIYFAANVDDPAQLEPGAAINIEGSHMAVDLVKLDLNQSQCLTGDTSAKIKRVEYRINGANWTSYVLNGSSSVWIPLDPGNVTSFEVMALRGDTLVKYEVFE
jgi:hypothetical protein